MVASTCFIVAARSFLRAAHTRYPGSSNTCKMNERHIVCVVQVGGGGVGCGMGGVLAGVVHVAGFDHKRARKVLAPVVPARSSSLRNSGAAVFFDVVNLTTTTLYA